MLILSCEVRVVAGASHLEVWMLVTQQRGSDGADVGLEVSVWY